MIDREALDQILAQYAKHGWKLRRVLLSKRLADELADISSSIGDVETLDSEIDGLWFSRSSRPDVTAWELRRLSQDPFALVTSVPSDADQETTEAILKEAESQMLATRKPDH